MKTPTLDAIRMVFGFSLLMIIAALVIAIALGKVEEKTSYGLMPLLIILSTCADKFAGWAFSRDTQAKSQDEQRP